MLAPKKVKWRRPQRGRMKGKAKRGNTLAFGDCGTRIDKTIFLIIFITIF